MDLPFLPEPEPVTLDYAGAAGIGAVLTNLSGVAAEGDRLWSVSDEGRRVECLERDGTGYRLTGQIRLGRRFPGLPDGEADLESVDCAGGRLWLGGSHTRVRRPAEGLPQPKLRDRPCRNLLGWVDAAGGDAAFALPFAGQGSLRERLGRDAFLRDFIALPSKENGVDIEGLAVLGDRLFLGLRGPLIDSHALVLDCPVSRAGRPKLARIRRHFLGLEGLGIRDLARDGSRLLVLAGPVAAAAGPFTLHAWTPGAAEVEGIARWREDGAHPEGICRLDRDGRRGLLVVYDAPLGGRIDGTRYRADWFALPGLQPARGSR